MKQSYLCSLCQHATIASGRDKLLYEDSFCYIAENGSRELHVESLSGVFHRHISLTMQEHIGSPDRDTVQQAYYTLAWFVTTQLGIPDGGFFLIRTMNTFPEHYHIHAYILPRVGDIKEKKE